jgi:NADP-dependent 3-hydroxy acid dehydrogenase YdfG
MTDEIDAPTDRVVVVSGAGTGIGRETAIQFGALGWRVAIGGRRVEKLSETAEAVVAAGGQCLPAKLDVTDADSVEWFFAQLEAEFGTATAVINNAGTARYGPLAEFSPAEIAAEVATKLTGALYMSRRGIEGMQRDRQGGDILFMSSVSAIQLWPLHVPYAAASAGVEHAAQTLKLELEGTGIRVTNLRCGQTLGTEFGSRDHESEYALAVRDRWFRLGLLRHGNMMTPGDVAAVIVKAVTQPRGTECGLIEVTPTAPIGAQPATLGEWRAAVAAAAMSRLQADQVVAVADSN